MLDSQLGNLSSAASIISAPPTFASTSIVRRDTSNKQTSSQDDQLVNNIHSMPLEALRHFAVASTRKVKHLEAEVNKLQTEISIREAQYARRSKQLHQSTTVRDEQLSKSLKQAEFELAAERSIRTDLEQEQSKLRDLCKKAKERIGELVLHRSELELKVEDLMKMIESLKDELAESALLQEQWKQQAETQQSEVDRQKLRGSRLEHIIQQYDVHAEARGLFNILNIVWNQVEEMHNRDSNVISDKEPYVAASSSINISDKSSLEKDCCQSERLPSTLTEQTFQKVLSNLASQLPTIPVDLSTITSLPIIEPLSSTIHKFSPSASSLSASTVDTLRSMSSSVIDHDGNGTIEEISLEDVDIEDALFQGQGEGDIPAVINFESSENYENQKSQGGVCVALNAISQDSSDRQKRNTSSCVSLTERSPKKVKKRKGATLEPSSSNRVKRGRGKGLLSRFQQRGISTSTEERYPVPAAQPIRKSQRIMDTIRKVQDEVFHQQRIESLPPKAQETTRNTESHGCVLRRGRGRPLKSALPRAPD